MEFRSFLAVAAAVVTLAGVSACGSDEASDSAATMVPVTTVAPTTTVLATTDVSTTAAATTATTLVSTTAIATTAVATTQLATTVPTTAAPTTTAAAATSTTVASTAPCDLDTIVRQTDTAYEGVTAITLRCAGDWASWVGQPDDATASDGFFAVAQWNGSAWELANLGTAGICGDGGVPPELWDALGCVE